MLEEDVWKIAIIYFDEGKDELPIYHLQLVMCQILIHNQIRWTGGSLMMVLQQICKGTD
jgi:hypothetical protein